MIEILVGPLIGEAYSFEAEQNDNKDGGPPQGGELIIALDPSKFGSHQDPYAHAEKLFAALLDIEGTRLPGESKFNLRNNTEEVEIPYSLYQEICQLAGE